LLLPRSFACQKSACYLQVSEACPVNICPSTAVAVIVTGLATAAVHVAVICGPCAAERCTEGSLTIQLEFTSAAAFPVHTPLPPPNKLVVLNIWLLAEAAAVWSSVAEEGATFNPTAAQLELPPQPAIASNAAQTKTLGITLDANIGTSDFCCAA
jgi:hypothetical protein